MYSRLLVPIDGSATSRLALSEATTLAKLSQATIVLLHVIDELEHSHGFERPLVYFNEVRPRFLQNGQALLDGSKAELESQQVPVETVLIESQGVRVSELIAQHAMSAHADIVVMGTHGRRGVDRFLIGSDAEQVARIAPVPVMLVRSKRDTPLAEKP